jgi:CMP-N-acetylneuraminic acid synthetase
MTAPGKNRILGFIPAKGVSTRLPRKNLALLAGRPLLAWAIDAARQSGVVDRIAVSSEDDEILQCAADHGADFPLVRPEALARDPAGIVDVALFALDQLERQGEPFEIIIILAPTAPLRTADDVANCLAIYKRVQPNFVMSVSPFAHTPFAALTLNEVGELVPVFPEHFGRKSQDMPAAFRPNGAVHVLGVGRFRQVKSYLEPPLVPYVMPRERAVDIDVAADLIEAQILLAGREHNHR